MLFTLPPAINAVELLLNFALSISVLVSSGCLDRIHNLLDAYCHHEAPDKYVG